MLWRSQHDSSEFESKGHKLRYLPDLIVLLEYMIKLRKVQTFETSHFY